MSKLLPLIFLVFLSALPFSYAVAESSAPPPRGSLSTQRFVVNTLMFVVSGFVGYYFLVTKPLIKKEDDQTQFVAGLKKNDPVIVSPGIYGKISQVQGDEIFVELANGVRVKVLPKALEAPPAPNENTKAA